LHQEDAQHSGYLVTSAAVDRLPLARWRLVIARIALKTMALLVTIAVLAGCNQTVMSGTYATPSAGGWDNFRG